MKIISSLLLLIFISSCGFQSIYKADNAGVDGEDYKQELAAIGIKKGYKYIDQQLNNNLENILNPDSLKVDHKYLLTIQLKKTLTSALTTSTGSSGRNKVILTASYTLKNLESGQLISTEEVTAKDDFDVQDRRFGNYIAEQTIGSNLTKILAQNIRDLLIRDLAEQNDK